MEIETFIHGAMCISYSGRCLLSSFMAGRDANRGACTHPCRWKYAVMEESTDRENICRCMRMKDGTYIFNSKDLCMIEHIGELMESGIDSYKNRRQNENGTVCSDRGKNLPDGDRRLAERSRTITNPEFRIIKQRSRNVPIVSILPDFSLENRMKQPESTTVIPISKNIPIWGIVGEEKDGHYRMEQRNKFSVGETIEVMKPNGENIEGR